MPGKLYWMSKSDNSRPGRWIWFALWFPTKDPKDLLCQNWHLFTLHEYKDTVTGHGPGLGNFKLRFFMRIVRSLMLLTMWRMGRDVFKIARSIIIFERRVK